MFARLAPAARIVTIAVAGLAFGCSEETSIQADSDFTADTEAPAIFFEDDGVSCFFVVETPSAIAADDSAAREHVAAGLRAASVDVCPLTDPTIVELYQIGELDDYGQPDWSTANPLGSFEIVDWPALLEVATGSASADSPSLSQLLSSNH